jgi:hypothetical protein
MANHQSSLRHLFRCTALVLLLVPNLAADRPLIPTFSVQPSNSSPQNSSAMQQWIYTGLRGGNQRFSSLIINPRSPSIIYASTSRFGGADFSAFGGFRSDDGGKNWSKMPICDPYISNINGKCIAEIDGLVMDSANPSILYAYSRTYFYRSIDGGNKWQLIYLPNDLYRVSKPINLPSDKGRPVHYFLDVASFGQTIYISDDDAGLWQSKNGGATWEHTSVPGKTKRIVLDPSNSNVVYVAGSYGVYKTRDAGTSWIPCNNGVVDQFPSGMWVQDLAIAPSNTSILYRFTPGCLAEMYKSIDGGDSWLPIADTLKITCKKLPNCAIYAQGRFAIDPTNPSIVYLAAGAVWKSQDGGKTWAALMDGLKDCFSSDDAFLPIALHPQQPWIIFAASHSNGVFTLTQSPYGSQGQPRLAFTKMPPKDNEIASTILIA